MITRFEERDPVTGIITRWVLDTENDKVIIQKVNPATQQLIDSNQAALNDSLNRKWGEGQVFASVPLETYQEQLAEAVRLKDWKYVKKYLNDADNRAYRRFHGNV